MDTELLPSWTARPKCSFRSQHFPLVPQQFYFVVIFPPFLTFWEDWRCHMSQHWLRQGTTLSGLLFSETCLKLTGSNLHCRFLNLLFPQSQRKFLER